MTDLGPIFSPSASSLSSWPQVPEFVVVQVIPVDDLDAPQILGVVDALEAGDHEAQRETLAAAARARRSGRRR